MNEYDDIINMPHHVSSTHPQMSMLDRAAQFSPFAALTGHGDAVKETARLTDEKAELTEDEISALNNQLNYLSDHADERPEITVEYFVPDERKSGGAYVTITGNFKRVNVYDNTLVFVNGEIIPINEINKIHGILFSIDEK